MLAETTVILRRDEGARRVDEHKGWLLALEREPWRFDFYHALRSFEARHPQLPRLGEAMRPADEPVRLAQSSELSFAPAPLQELEPRDEAAPRLTQRILGLLGPNGALPIHLTELADERARHHGDATLKRFLDLLTHRLTLLFYRAWAQAQPVLSLDRPGDTQFLRRLGALSGLGLDSLLGRDALGDMSKLHLTGRLARQVRDADGLEAWGLLQFGTAVRVQQWQGHWMPLARSERSRLGHSERNQGGVGSQLGAGAVLGASVWDVQHKFRLVIGPLRLERYLAFLPGGQDLARLQAMVRQWVGFEFAWDLRLILARVDVPPLRLAGASQPGHRAMLGRTTWLGRFRRDGDADDLVLDVESTVRPRRVHRAAAASAHEHPPPAAAMAAA